MVRDSKALGKVSLMCLGLPESSMERSGSHATFRVRKKVFAYFLDDHHGDGIVSVCVKTQLGENRDLARQDPETFYLPAYIGARGWIGYRIDRGSIDWKDVAKFVKSSYCQIAPKKLVAAVKG